jgi:uncharacterized protein YciI
MVGYTLLSTPFELLYDQQPGVQYLASTVEAERGTYRRAGKGRNMVRHFLLFYEAGPDYVQRRPQFRAQHLGLAWAAQERGDLVVAGPLADPVDGAVLMFVGEDKSVAEDFAHADPYVTSGMVARWYVREWTTVIGDLALTPVRPADA